VADLAGLALRQRRLAPAGLVLAEDSNLFRHGSKQGKFSVDLVSQISALVKLKLVDCA
jgi:hypothetical protein